MKKTKILQINTFPTKATGHIMMSIHKMLTDSGYDSYVCWGRGRQSCGDHEIVISNNIDVKIHGMYTRVFDKTGFASRRLTRKFLRRLDEIQPDIIHLHNIHGYYLNIEMLFGYIREHNIKIVWTLHDCWALTGHCAWFDACNCEKWKTGCHDCEQIDTYPISRIFDNSRWNWKKKKELFTGLDINIVTPSKWLAALVKESYLKKYPVKVIYNGIDLNTFKPTLLKDTKEKYGLDNRPVVLGVASEWTPRKGLSDIIKLSQIMRDIQFVVVGLTEKQKKDLPKNMIGIKRTENQNELAALYTVANVFFNPTYEDNFPTTNLEALACGTPIVTYDTGGSSECIDNIYTKLGIIVGSKIRKISSQKIDLREVIKELNKMIDSDNQSIRCDCRLGALQFNQKQRLKEYIVLYGDILS